MAKTTLALPRCNDHKTREALPQLCHTCQRIAVEHDIVTRTVDALLAAGYHIRESEDGAFEDGRDDTLAVLFDLDDAFLVARHEVALKSGWVRFVFGNGGWDVISDYTTNLEDVLAPVNAYADTLS